MQGNTPLTGEVSRRVALGAGAGMVGALAARSTAAAAPASSADVIIVGAGFAGLTTATRLRAAGRSVAVLEADDRVGGRTKPGVIAGEVVDLGGQWVGPTQTRLLALAKAHGVATYPQYASGLNIADFAGHSARYEGEIPALPPEAMTDFAEVVGGIETLAAAAPATAPWNLADSGTLDSQTVETWLHANARTEPVRALMRVLTRALMSVEPSQISMLALIAYSASAGGFSALISTRGGAQDSLFEGGAWRLAAKMAADLGHAVTLNTPVDAIIQDDHGVTVTSADRSWRARYVVVTAPPAMAGRIRYSPPMPALRDGLSQRMPLGSVIKAHIAYARPFWREQGLSGLVLSDRTEFGPWFDHSPEHGGTGSLVGFFDGGPAQRWADRPAEARKAQVLKDLALYLGEGALTPIDYVEEVWTRAPWNRGGYVSVPGPGVLTAFGAALREPVGRIHWAGTETAEAWVGYIDGAVRSGEKVAETLAALL